MMKFYVFGLVATLLWVGPLPADASSNDTTEKPPLGPGCFVGVGCFPKSDIAMTPYPQPPEKIGMSYVIFNEKSLREVKHKFMYYETEGLLKLMGCANETHTESQPKYSNLTILTHGFFQDIIPQEKHPDEFSYLKDSLIKTLLPRGHLVVNIDWADGARPPDYAQASVNTRMVGKQVSLFIKEVLKRKCIPPQNIHLIGFSLGAHISGFVGQYIRDEEHVLLGRISGGTH